MGEAMIAALVRRGSPPGDIVACDVVAERRQHLASAYGVATEKTVAKAAAGAPIVVLAVKPQDFAKAVGPLRSKLAPEQTVVSIMAGVSMADLAAVLNHDRLVRAMPNTPAQIGAGFVAWTAAAAVDEAARAAIGELLGTLGVAVEVAGDVQIDMATAVSGSGPGYVYLLIEAMIDGAVAIGLGRDLATAMVTQTVLGSTEYLRVSGEHPAVLRARVTSPGGTTAAGLAAMEEFGVRAGLAAAIRAAYERAHDMGASPPSKRS